MGIFSTNPCHLPYCSSGPVAADAAEAGPYVYDAAAVGPHAAALRVLKDVYINHREELGRRILLQ